MLGMSSKLPSSDIPKNPSERRAWIQYQLRLQGTNFRALGKSIGCSQQAVSQAASGLPSFDVERAIADAIGIAHATLFPEHFRDNGERIPAARPRRRKSTPPSSQRNVYSEKVA